MFNKINFQTATDQELVKRVSTENITQLLEALVADSVLNELEKESILEKNPTRANKASDLFNTVIKKGDQACRKTIHHLTSLDSHLCSHLHLRSASSCTEGEFT
uniref:CARD domain-containing protein n=1 Tax=Poecilia reticulata TaxID=8081 RepID=A0A3P9P4M4_POERE